MLIKTRLYLVAIILIILSAVALIFTIRNKNAAVCRAMIGLSILGIIYLFFAVTSGMYLSVGVGFEILFLYAAGAVAGVLYVVTIVINIVKKKSITKTYFATNYSLPKAFKILMLVLILLPVLFVSVRIVRDRILIARCDAIVLFYSGGNGGIGDGKLFAFAMKGNSCKRFDLGIDLYLDELVPKNAVRIKPDWGDVTIGEYEIDIDKEERIIILRDRHEIYKFDTYKHGYFNIEVQEGYYVEKQK